MSVTSQLQDPSSMLSRFYDIHQKSDLSPFINFKNDLLSNNLPIVVEGADPLLVGGAFGYALRWWLAPDKMKQTVAAHGASRMHQEAVFESMLHVATEMPQAIPLFSIIMAKYDKAGRGGKPDNFFEDFAEHFKPILALPLPSLPALQNIQDQLKQDAQLRQCALDLEMLYKEIPKTWGERQQVISARHQLVFSPTFDRSEDVGGADGWLILDGVLWDCKTTRKRRPFDKNNLLQQLTYVLLDESDEYHLHSIGWYYARQRVQIVIPLVKLVANLKSLRGKFADWCDTHNEDDYSDFVDDYESYEWGDRNSGSSEHSLLAGLRGLPSGDD